MAPDVLSFIHTFHPHLNLLFSIFVITSSWFLPSFTAFPRFVSPFLTATCRLCMVLFTGQDVRLRLLPLVLLFLTGSASALFTFNQWQTSEGTVAVFELFSPISKMESSYQLFPCRSFIEVFDISIFPPPLRSTPLLFCHHSLIHSFFGGLSLISLTFVSIDATSFPHFSLLHEFNCVSSTHVLLFIIYIVHFIQTHPHSLLNLRPIRPPPESSSSPTPSPVSLPPLSQLSKKEEMRSFGVDDEHVLASTETP